MASTEARKIAHTGFLPKIDINADGTLNMSDLNAWNEPVGEYRNHTYQGVFIVSQPLYTGGALNAQHKIAKADERLNQLNEELTIDQIHYQSDASLLECFCFTGYVAGGGQVSKYCEATV